MPLATGNNSLFEIWRETRHFWPISRTNAIEMPLGSSLRSLPWTRYATAPLARRAEMTHDERVAALLAHVRSLRDRRGTLGTLLGGVLTALGVTAVEEAEGKKKKKKCRSPKVRCGKKLCCAAGLNCSNGQCIDPRCGFGGTQCGVGQICESNTCICDEDLCRDATNPNPGRTTCFCGKTPQAQTLCMADQSCADPIPCAPDGSCTGGRVCLQEGCANNPTCLNLCT